MPYWGQLTQAATGLLDLANSSQVVDPSSSFAYTTYRLQQAPQVLPIIPPQQQQQEYIDTSTMQQEQQAAAVATTRSATAQQSGSKRKKQAAAAADPDYTPPQKQAPALAGTSLKCDHCSAVLAHKDSLTQHIQRVHMNVRNHKCPKCDFAAYHQHELQVHVRSAHTKTGKLPCLHCDKKFATETTLRTHFDRMHPREKMPTTSNQQFVCEKCAIDGIERAFTTEFARKYHQETEHAKPKHVCPFCALIMKSEGALKGHIKRMHPDKVGVELPAKCTMCQLPNDYDHSSGGGGARLYDCQQCGKRFTTYSSAFSYCACKRIADSRRCRCRRPLLRRAVLARGEPQALMRVANVRQTSGRVGSATSMKMTLLDGAGATSSFEMLVKRR